MSHVSHRSPNRNPVAEASKSHQRPGAVQTNKKTRAVHPPRQRMSLRSAMRFHGLDEHKIATGLRRQLNRLQRLISKTKLNAAHEKLFLEVTKECVKIMEPAARANSPQDSGTVQLVHDIPRPVRDFESTDFSTSRYPSDRS